MASENGHPSEQLMQFQHMWTFTPERRITSAAKA